MSTASLVLAHTDGNVRVLTLNRPQVANALNAAAHEMLAARLAEAANDASVRAVVLTATGERVFSAGADLKELAAAPATEDSLPWRSPLVNTLGALIDFPKPLVCAVQGKAIGAGWMLALAADAIIAADSAEFSLPEIHHAMPTSIGAAMLGTRVSTQLTRMLVQTGEPIDAKSANALGLVDTVVTGARLLPEAVHRAATLGASAARTYAANKQWINRALRAQLELAAQYGAELKAKRG